MNVNEYVVFSVLPVPSHYIVEQIRLLQWWEWMWL